MRSLIRVAMTLFAACAIPRCALAQDPPSKRTVQVTHAYSALNDVRACEFTGEGQVIAGTAGGLRLADGVVLTALDGLPDTQVDALRMEAEHVVVETPKGRVRVSLETHSVMRMSAPAPHVRSLPSFEHFQGALVRMKRRGRGKYSESACIATSDGLYVARGASAPERVQPKGSTLPAGDIAAMAATATHGLFVGSFDRGLYRIDGTTVEPVVDAALNPNINALAWDEARNTLWVATARGLVRCEWRTPCKRIGDGEGKHAVMLMRSGHILAGGDGGLLFVTPDGAIEFAPTHKSGLPFRAVWALAEAEDGVLYVGTTNGLWFGSAAAFQGLPQLERRAMVDGSLPDDWVTALAIRKGELFAGTYNAGVVRFERAAKTLVASGADASLGYVNPAGISVLPDGELAVSTMRGLRIGAWGDFRRVATLGSDVTGIVQTGDGRRWAASRRGVNTF
jgi:ligand-binding sensor domain-containing protein